MVGHGVLLHMCATGALWTRCSRTLLAAAPVLCARVAGPFSRLSSSLVMVLGLIVAYSSHCARRCAACIREVPLAGARRLRLCEVWSSFGVIFVQTCARKYSGVLWTQTVI